MPHASRFYDGKSEVRLSPPTRSYRKGYRLVARVIISERKLTTRSDLFAIHKSNSQSWQKVEQVPRSLGQWN
jgi:hypothetical protein